MVINGKRDVWVQLTKTVIRIGHTVKIPLQIIKIPGSLNAANGNIKDVFRKVLLMVNNYWILKPTLLYSLNIQNIRHNTYLFFNLIRVSSIREIGKSYY